MDLVIDANILFAAFIKKQLYKRDSAYQDTYTVKTLYNSVHLGRNIQIQETFGR